MSSPAVSSFGAHEAQRLVDIVRLSRVTSLVADRDSDKSALLRSVVMPLLERDTAGAKPEIAILFDAWDEAPLSALRARIDQAAAAAHPAVPIADGSSLAASLRALQEALGATFLIIFDRFEQHLRAPQERGAAEFDASFAEVVNDRSLRVNFLLAFDVEAEPLFLQLRKRIPQLGDARVRLPRAVQAPQRQSLADDVASEPPRAIHTEPVLAAPPREGAALNHPEPGRKIQSSIFAARDALHAHIAPLLAEGKPSPIVEAAPLPIVEPAPPPLVEATPPPVVETPPPPVVEAAPPPIVEVAPQSIVEAAPPPIIEAAPSPLVEATPPPIVEAAPPPIIQVAPPPIVEAAPPPVVEAAPPPVVEAAPPPIVEVAPSLAHVHASEAPEESAPQEPSIPERVAPKRRLVPLAWAASILVAGALFVLWDRGSGERAETLTAPPAGETVTAAPRAEAPPEPKQTVAAAPTPPPVESPAPSEAPAPSPPAAEQPAPAEKLLSPPRPPAPVVSAPSAVQPETAAPKPARVSPPAPVEATRTTQSARRSEVFAGRPGAAPPASPSAGGNAAQRASGKPAAGSAAPSQAVAKAPPQAAAPPAPAAVPAAPALYINISNEAQRARAEQLVKPLKERGITVAGIRVVPPNPDGTHIRYNHTEERSEAMKLSITLRDFGLGTQHLRQAEESASPPPARQYELWLPATGEPAR